MLPTGLHAACGVHDGHACVQPVKILHACAQAWYKFKLPRWHPILHTGRHEHWLTPDTASATHLITAQLHVNV